jgi:hypothetical protein
MINLSSGEKATVQISTGPTSMLPTFSPVARSHSLRLESNELEAQAEIIKITVLLDIKPQKLVASYQHFRETCCNQFLLKMEATG